ncbi:hypothetical protein FRC17_003102 [Serendipita sp. 399]|nr:hypothetical protein FRC17_003102 [Serendipita sp. 399]
MKPWRCQDLTLSEQLHQGIRMIDIRIVLVDGELRAYHGVTPEKATFTAILDEVCSYLESEEGKSETVIMSILEEASFMPSSPFFSALVHDAITNPPSRKGMWFLENRVPTLGEVRSKIILFSRFGGDGDGWEGGRIGIHPTIWPDNRREGFAWELEKTRVRTQDWYGIPSFLSIPEKFEVAVEMLYPRPAPNGKSDLSITFLSASRVPFALPSTVACGFGWSSLYLGIEGVNSRVGKWLLGQLGGVDGNDVAPGEPKQAWTYSDEERGWSQSTLVDLKSASGSSIRIKDSDRKEPRLRGWVLMDFLLDPHELGIVPLLIECNWRGRVHGEEGWV